jgi:hypothetical protein
MKETTYINHGVVYKTSVDSFGKVKDKTVVFTTKAIDGTDSNYFVSPITNKDNINEYDSLIHVKAEKKDSQGIIWTKTYKSTKEYRSLLNMDTEQGFDMSTSDLPLCPDVDIWGGIGLIKGDDSFIELYFNVTSSENMQDVSDYYGLENPLPLDNDLNSNRRSWIVRDFGEFDLVLASVVFKDKVQQLIKIYKYDMPELVEVNNGEV